ncbi:hypothetical protein [Massilia sp. METH4]|uniref:hypothetical protein n=1 Tax=Massilia sp. METH4 TaxID=3123041 RepID=UPI0030D39C5E
MFVDSQHVPERIEVLGFEAADDSVHMLAWLRKGKDFRQFVVNDIETELYAQDANSQLLSVNCKEKPTFDTKVKTDQQAKTGVVTQFRAAFPVSVRVRSGNGAVWRLEVEHSYQAINLDVPDKFQLRLDFTIVGHQIEA